MPTHPLTRTLTALLAAAHAPRTHRTKRAYRAVVQARDRAYFEQAWAILRRSGHLVPDLDAPAYRPARYIAPPPAAR